jgi:hypothetical protein
MKDPSGHEERQEIPTVPIKPSQELEQKRTPLLLDLKPKHES